MNKTQSFYRELRKSLTPDDARYAAPRILDIMERALRQKRIAEASDEINEAAEGGQFGMGA